MKKVAVVSSTRADYGLLSPIIKELRDYESNDFIVHLLVTGTHLSEDYGMTVSEIDTRIDHCLSISVKSDSELSISMNQAETLVAFTKLFCAENYNAVLLLGDRYEMLAIAIAAGNTRTPVFHISGGDTTEGAIDEWIRHSITKISYLHFVTNEESRRRVIQLGEDPSRVYNYGSTSIDNIISIADMSKEEALRSVSLQDCKYALCTYHPTTMEDDNLDNQVFSFLDVIKHFSNIEFIVTKSNADLGGAQINQILDKAEKHIRNLHVYSSLGVHRYLSLMKYAEFVLGNSSSGIVEAPAFHVPTINIGDRQRGRLQSQSIINCGTSTEDIVAAINKSMTEAHIKKCDNSISPYGDGHAAEKIAQKVFETIQKRSINLKKKFYNI